MLAMGKRGKVKVTEEKMPNCFQPQLELQRNILNSKLQQRFIPRYHFSFFFVCVIEASLLPCYHLRI